MIQIENGRQCMGAETQALGPSRPEGACFSLGPQAALLTSVRLLHSFSLQLRCLWTCTSAEQTLCRFQALRGQTLTVALTGRQQVDHHLKILSGPLGLYRRVVRSTVHLVSKIPGSTIPERSRSSSISRMHKLTACSSKYLVNALLKQR